MILIFNKVDLVKKMPTEEERQNMSDFEFEEGNFLDLEKLSQAYEKKTGIEPVFMAAQDGTNVEQFREVLIGEVKKQHMKMYPHYLEDEVIDMSQFKDFE